MNTEEFVDMLPKEMSESNDPMDMFIELDVDETDLPTDDGLDDDDNEVFDNWIEGIVEASDGTASDKELVNTLLRKCPSLISFIKRSTILRGRTLIQKEETSQSNETYLLMCGPDETVPILSNR